MKSPTPTKSAFLSAARYIQSRIHPDLGLSNLPPAKFASALLKHLQSPARKPSLYNPVSLAKSARLAQKLDPAQYAWEKAMADKAVNRVVHAATDPFGPFTVTLTDNFDFNDGSSYQDPQAIYGLNRCRWFASLARTYWDTQNPAYLSALLWHWDLYTRQVPDPTPADCDKLFATGQQTPIPPSHHQLNCFIRLTSWWHAFWLSIHTKEMTPQNAVLLLSHCLKLFDYVHAHGTRKQEHNFTSMQMQGLYYWALSLPEFIGMNAVKNMARNTLEFSMARAVFPDGAHWEQSVGYQIGCVIWYGGPALLGKLHNDAWSPVYLDTLKNMGNLVDALIEPDGDLFSTSDSDRKSNWALALGTLTQLFPAQSFEHPAPASYEAVWLTGGRLKKSPATLPEKSGFKLFSYAGLAVAKDISSPKTSMLLFDNGSADANHAHLDFLSVCWTPLGVQALLDPGRWIYDAKDPDRIWVKSMQSHNTLWILPADAHGIHNHRDLAGRMPPKDPRLSPILASEKEGLVILQSTFSGHADDRLAQTTRRVYFPAPANASSLPDSKPATRDSELSLRWLLIIDHFTSPNPHTWANSWLTPGDTPVSLAKHGFNAALSTGLHLSCLTAADHPLSSQSLPKFWSQNYNQKQPAQWTILSGKAKTGTRAFLFLASTSASKNLPKPTLTLKKGAVTASIPGLLSPLTL